MLRVVTPPEPIVAPEEILGATAGDEAVAGLIAAVTEEIDGPSGWLGRSLGPQTIEWTDWIGCRRVAIPCRPIIQIESVVAIDKDGNEEIVDPSSYRQDGDCIVVADGAAWMRFERHRIRYEAGYNGTAGAGAGEVQTGDVPERARQAIILSVQDLIRTGAATPGLRSETVEGVGAQTYLDGDKIAAIVDRTCQRLLSTLRIYTL